MGHLAHSWALEAACPPVHPHRHLGLTQQCEPCPPDILCLCLNLLALTLQLRFLACSFYPPAWPFDLRGWRRLPPVPGLGSFLTRLLSLIRLQ